MISKEFAVFVIIALVASAFGQPSPSDRGLEKLVWIAWRTDGEPGTGTAEDPLDGSTQVKLDAIFKFYYDTHTTFVTFHVGPGTFPIRGKWSGATVEGGEDWSMLKGWKIKGAGISQTIFYQIGSQSFRGAVFESRNYGWGTGLDFEPAGYQSVEDCTLDLAFFRSGPGGSNADTNDPVYMGVSLKGPNCVVRNVEVKHGGSTFTESFPLAIMSGAAADSQNIPHNAMIENCWVHHPGAAATGIAIINLIGRGESPVYATGGRLINNVLDYSAGVAAGQGVGLAGFDGGIVSGNVLYGGGGAGSAIYDDTFANKNLLITGNTISHFAGGIYMIATPPTRDLRIVNNTISECGTGIALQGDAANSTIESNHIKLPTIAGTFYGITLDTKVAKITVKNNEVGAGLNNIIPSTTHTAFNNRDENGDSVIPDTDYPDLTQAAKRITFTAPSVGWYRVYTAPAYGGGTLTISHAGVVTSNHVELKIDFAIHGYFYAQPRIGHIIVRRNTMLRENLIALDQIRISREGAGAFNGFLDIHVNDAGTWQLVYEPGASLNPGILNPAPTVGAVAGTYDNLVYTVIPGFLGGTENGPKFLDTASEPKLALDVSARAAYMGDGTTEAFAWALGNGGFFRAGPETAGAFPLQVTRDGSLLLHDHAGNVVFSGGDNSATFAFLKTGDTAISGKLTATVQAISGPGAINLSTLSTAYTSTGASQSLTLANGSDGQIKTIAHVSDGGSGILIPMSRSGYSSITLTNAGDAVTLQFFSGAGWIVIGQKGVTIAP